MIEIIYQGEEENQIQDSDFKLPKNVRQIGDSGFDNRKIYVEDFVMTFVKHFSSRQLRYGVLLGNIKRNSGNTYLFIKGAVCARPMLDNEIIFDEDVWTGIYEDIKTYFDDVEIVGWFLSMPGMLANDMAQIQKLHLDNFAGNDKVCFILDRVECEDSFYLYDDGGMRKCEGHYIYYEKNSDMQSYMLMNEDVSEIPSEYEQSRKRTINAKVHKILYKVDKDTGMPVTQNASESGNAKTGNSSESKSGSYSLRPYIQPASSDNQTGLGNAASDSEGAGRRRVGRRVPVFAYSASSFMIIAILLAGVAIMNASGQLNDLRGTVAKMASGTVTDKGSDKTEGKKSEDMPEIVDVAANITTEDEKNTDAESKSETESVESQTAEKAADERANETTNTQADTGKSQQSNEQNNENTQQTNEQSSEKNQQSNEQNDGKAQQSNEQSNEHNSSETATKEASVAPATSELNYYTVKEGDSLYSISRKIYGNVSMIDKIREANGMDSTDENIVIGQKLVLP